MIEKPLNPSTAAMFVVVASFGGVAYHLWKNEPFWTRRMIGAVLLSAAFGAGIACWCYTDLHDCIPKLIAIALAGGIGATNVIDVVLAIIVKNGKRISEIVRKIK